MKITQNIFFVVLLISVIACKVYAGQATFNPPAFEQIKAKNFGQPWLLVAWSLDCPPCFKELALIQQLRQQYPGDNDLVPIVLVNTDDSDELALERTRILKAYQLLDLDNYAFRDGQADRDRYTLDANWYGELPRSYFVDAQGQFKGKSGVLAKSLLTQWLRQSALEK